jgi:hypothetical protein
MERKIHNIRSIISHPKYIYITKVFLRFLFLFLVEQNDFNCIAIGRNSIIICHENNQRLELKSPLLEESTFLISYCPIDDGRRYLLTDDNGKLYLLILERDKRNGSSSTTIIDMKVIIRTIFPFEKFLFCFSSIFSVKYPIVFI